MTDAMQQTDAKQQTEERTVTATNREPDLQLDRIVRAVTKRSFCTLATVSTANRPHAAGVLYEAVGTAQAESVPPAPGRLGPSAGMTLYVNTLRSSRKARNIADNPHVGVVIPIRRLPLGPPAAVQFQAVAELLANDDPHIVRLLENGHLKSITGHGELDNPEGCFVRITPARRINTYGLGMSLRRLLRDPLDAGGSIELPA